MLIFGKTAHLGVFYLRKWFQFNMHNFDAQNNFDTRLQNFSCLKARKNFVQTIKCCLNKK